MNLEPLDGLQLLGNDEIRPKTREIVKDRFLAARNRLTSDQTTFRAAIFAARNVVDETRDVKNLNFQGQNLQAQRGMSPDLPRAIWRCDLNCAAILDPLKIEAQRSAAQRSAKWFLR